jgi:uncharacterized membrane-anchored protein
MMPTRRTASSSHDRTRLLLNKVPEVTVYFWAIKVLCTTVGETAADFLNVNLNFGLTGTSLVTGLLLAIALVFQFRTDRYTAAPYWITVALVSVFGTLVTDNLSDQVGVPLEASTIGFGLLLAGTFLAWYRSERTLSIHTILTPRREAYYWLAILFTFALGTAAGDLMAEVLGLGYAATGGIVVAVIALVAAGWRLGLHPVLAFWIIYILTRPFGASLGDYLSQPRSNGGIEFGPTMTSLVFTIAILVAVTYLAVTKVDVTPADRAGAARRGGQHQDESAPGGLWQTAVVLVVLLAVSTVGYSWRKATLTDDARNAAQVSATTGAGPASALGDLTPFRVITQDTLNLVNGGNQSKATTRVTDLETAWDNAEARLKPRDPTAWTAIDDKIDTVLRKLRAANPHADEEKAALSDLLTVLK